MVSWLAIGAPLAQSVIMATQHRPPEPPEPPPMERRVDAGPVQWIGFPLLLVLPVLALFGVFGDRQGRATVRSAEIEMSVDWPARTRHERTNDIGVRVRNVSNRVIDTLTIAFDSAYLAGFADVSLTPEAAQAWEVELAGMRPGEARHVVAGIDARRHGRHAGPVTATAGGPDTARLNIDTFIFP